MIFTLKFLDRNHSETIDGELITWGLIQIGEFEERLLISLSVWSVTDYANQWKDGLTRILNHPISCVYTSMRDLSRGSFINRWVLYREGDSVFIQNNIVLANTVSRFNPQTDLYQYMPDRKEVTDDGHKISEWKISIENIQEFINML